jgi:cytochrome c oxidase subunit 2
MRSWVEAVLAIVVLIALGAVLLLFSGESLTDGSPTTTAPVESDPEAAARGEEVANSIGCLACHTVDGTPGSSGPTWKGLAGSSRPLESGEVVIADDEYLVNSIIDPNLQIVAGYDPVMPDYSDQLTADEVDDLVEYIKSLAS